MNTPSPHPRPQLQRPTWRSLDGEWQFAYDDMARWQQPADVTFDRTIMVPYAPESALSGIHDSGFHPVAWYAREISVDRQEVAGRVLVHFGAIDYAAQVWAGGRLVGQHEGGHTPFTVDITEALGDGDTVQLVVRAEDDPHELAQPRGKQDWKANPHIIWYPRTTGIWQSVWLEWVPETRVEFLRWTPWLDHWELGLEVQLTGPMAAGLRVRVRLHAQGRELVEDTYKLTNRNVSRRIAIPDPGIDDARNELLWSPEHPQLIQATIEVMDGERVVDQVQSYTALRSVTSDGQRFLLNGNAYTLKMVLDQGYWPQGLMTATDEELRRDVELTKRLGFNGARKHQKVENPRWLYWCDVLGLLVWEEMPSSYRFTPEGVERLTREWMEVIRRDVSHPCIVAWVPFNESWGVPDLPTNPAQRDYVRALYHLTRTLDPSRLVIGNDGWEHVATDLLGIHDYAHDPAVLTRRYGSPEALSRLLTQPFGRRLLLDDFSAEGKPAILSEFGGIAYSLEDERGWGYHRAGDSTAFLELYEGLLAAVHECDALAGFCYTQLTDTFQEKNGILTENREPKADLARLALATRGPRHAWDIDLDPDPHPLGYTDRWREREAQARPEDLHALK
ncbi:glycoside hydrolase family 2 TIM barrel-domain containing protein [Deinococcus humi]|uniref:Beta-galactosidase/beta-glucuronidase n=1 Tax=Deinococcus humi TaxID=662880 RepID=A0A7W8NEY0_9DEIO|nr:glycoside hydrolase family 2 TIM barrel-domain containing protein [Deinococcus humi]MBB5363826.1 beta-galactosidase/beta-glucuronidase [Deinococcus humi]GGO31828.1 beta-galactosidase [Deinococcus humi]